MRQLIKMKRKIYTKIERSLYAFVMLLLSVLSQDQHTRISRQVNGNILNSSGGNGNASSLPSLTERANVNSRHLSASSTASLAAAQMAASNNGAGPSVSLSNTANPHDPNRAYQLTHQHQQASAVNNQQQQQQQQLGQTQPPGNPASVSQQQQQQQQLQQQQQVPQFNSAQSQQIASQAPAASPQVGTQLGGGATPVMSTTFTFNPQTGQYQPTDLTTGLTPGLVSGPTNQQQQPSFNQFSNNFANPNGNIPTYGISPQQQQQQYYPYRPSQGSSSFNQQLGDSSTRYPAAAGNNQFTLNGINSLPSNLNQFVNQQRQVSQFSRRNGANFGSGSRFNTNLFGQPPANEDDGSGYYQQQQQQQQQQLGDLNQYGGVFDSSIYGNYLPYQQSNGQGGLIGSLDHSLIVPQPSSLAPVAQLPSSSSSSSSPNSVPTSFSSAFSGPPESSHKNEPQCVAADNRHGTCYQASECIRRGGTPMGKCGGSSSELTGSSYVCCLFDVSCGQFAAERFVYFRNPSYPNTYDQNRMCRAKIGKLDKGICQYRLDLLRFDVAKPTNGNCSQDMFVVSGQNENYVIPKICGLNDGQHYYVGVDESGVITLHMMMMGFYRRSFEIMITQIPCRSDYAAPAHCLQYYMGTHGTIKSFNYDDEQHSAITNGGYDLLPQASGGQLLDGTYAPTAPYGLQFNQQQQQRHQHHHFTSALNNAAGSRLANIYQSGGDLFGGYPNDLDYTMCIRKESGFCSITYQLSRSDQGLQPFAVGYQQPYGLAMNDSYAPNWQPVSTECRDDYLLIGGVRLCSGGGSHTGLNPFDTTGASIQFAQNGTILNSAGFGTTAQQYQQLQNQQNLLLQQLARLQQQQQQQLASSSSNVSYANSNGGNNQAAALNQSGQQQQQQQVLSNGSSDQQQASIMQQLLLVQQQLSLLAASQQGLQQQQQQQYGNGRPTSDLQGAIITDTTSGPFLLRFVSNLARNARGFHIDYRQNPCK